MSVFDDYKLIKPFKKRKLDYNTAYRLWYIRLSDKVLNLFKWGGLPFEQHELELRLQLYGNGYAGIVNASKLGRVITATGSVSGVTEYEDKFIDFTWTCPVAMGIDKIGETCAVIYNSSLHIPTRPLVQRYAHLLAHAELSLQAILINARATGIIAARDQKQKQDIADFYNALEDGRTMAIVDDDSLDSLVGSQGLRAVSTSYPAAHTIIDFWQIRQNLYKEFLAELGISKSTDKRERLIQSEVEQDEPMYQYALDDMLNCRRLGAETANRIFGLDITVEINPAVYAESDEISSGQETGVNDDDSNNQ